MREIRQDFGNIIEVQWFKQKVIRTCVQRICLRNVLVVGGQNHNRRFAKPHVTFIFSNGADRSCSVTDRHMQIHQHYIK